MKEFLLVFRMDPAARPTTTEQMQEMTRRWMDWVGDIADAGKLVDRGNRLEPSGKVVKSGGIVTDGPYTEIKESIGGYTMIRATSYEDATEIAKGCPVFSIGGFVEVREVGVIA
jgi:hypothetical protein